MTRSTKGFTLVEMLLVMVIISIMIYAGIGYMQQRTLQMRVDRASMQMQQILNGGLAYYVSGIASSSTHPEFLWPETLDDLKSAKFLPDITITSPWGNDYSLGSDTNKRMFYVWTAIVGGTQGTATPNAKVIAGTLPLSYTSSDPGIPGVAGVPGTPPDPGTICAPTATTCYVVTQVNIPGENLNRASAVNFAGLVKHGGCVPVPQCPDGTTAQVMIVPVSVSGVNDASPSTNVYPINSFTAYAKGPDADPDACETSTIKGDCSSVRTPTKWRACLQVITTKGDVQVDRNAATPPDNDYGKLVTLLAITRCSITDEPTTTGFTVFSN